MFLMLRLWFMSCIPCACVLLDAESNPGDCLFCGRRPVLGLNAEIRKREWECRVLVIAALGI